VEDHRRPPGGHEPPRRTRAELRLAGDREGTVTVVDARTFELLERRTTLPGAVQTETRTTELVRKRLPVRTLE
jgi:hypothetical protein